MPTELQRAILNIVDNNVGGITLENLCIEIDRQLWDLQSEGDLVETPKGNRLMLSDEGRAWKDFAEPGEDI